MLSGSPEGPGPRSDRLTTRYITNSIILTQIPQYRSRTVAILNRHWAEIVGRAALPRRTVSNPHVYFERAPLPRPADSPGGQQTTRLQYNAGVICQTRWKSGGPQNLVGGGRMQAMAFYYRYATKSGFHRAGRGSRYSAAPAICHWLPPRSIDKYYRGRPPAYRYVLYTPSRKGYYLLAPTINKLPYAHIRADPRSYRQTQAMGNDASERPEWMYTIISLPTLWHFSRGENPMPRTLGAPRSGQRAHFTWKTKGKHRFRLKYFI